MKERLRILKKHYEEITSALSIYSDMTSGRLSYDANMSSQIRLMILQRSLLAKKILRQLQINDKQ